MTALAGFLALCLAVGLSGSGLAAFGLHGWYLALHSPRWAPPIRVFLPVWTVLYLMSGVAAWEIWRVPDAPMQNRVLCRMHACWPDGFQPCRGNDFLPIPANASANCST